MYKFKTVMIFSKNVYPKNHDEYMALWSNGSFVKYEKYIGLLLIIGRAK